MALANLGEAGTPDDGLRSKVLAMLTIESLPIEAVASFQDMFQKLA
jgi:hypothetical protein